MQIYKFNPFLTPRLNSLDICAHALMRPWRVSLDQCLSCFLPTTQELKQLYKFIGSCFVTFPICFFLFIMTTIPGISGLLLWICICKKRSNFRISVSDNNELSKCFIRNNKNYMSETAKPVMNAATFKTTPYNSSQKSFAFATLNVCLLQEILSRYNNLDRTAKRADDIGRRLTTNQQLKFKKKTTDNNHNSAVKQNGRKRDDFDYQIPHADHPRKTYSMRVNDVETEMDVTVCSEFPETDFMIFQETWDNKLAESLMSHIHNIYPYIVYDVGERGLKENGYSNNSALMVASKFPILEVRFHLFPHRYSQDMLSSKGLLQVKVDLGFHEGKRKVGLIHATHLQVYPGPSLARLHQLDKIVKWTNEFRSDVKDDEVIAFDAVAGDFNFDNTSPVDKRDHSHSLFNEYRDICRIQPGQDHPFVIGTDMRYPTLHDDLISTPLGLKCALDDPILRQYYIMDGNSESVITSQFYRTMTSLDEDGNILPHPLGGRRRVDYILFRECDLVIPTAYNNVTLLAGLTDHICVSMTLKVK